MSLSSTTTENRDPDGLECYSDHAHDIATVYECTFCGSTDPQVVGHILPDVKRYKGVTDPVKASAIVMQTQSVTFFDGVLLDLYSASAVQAVYNALSTDEARAKLRAMPLIQAVSVCFRVIERTKERSG